MNGLFFSFFFLPSFLFVPFPLFKLINGGNALHFGLQGVEEEKNKGFHKKKKRKPKKKKEAGE
jgi:hypothetical protein